MLTATSTRSHTRRTATVSALPTNPEWSATVPALLALTCAAVAVFLNWRGADLPAQLFRVELFRRTGFTPFNLQWYDGHYTLGYSVLFPLAGAAFGPFAVGTASAVAAAWSFERIVTTEFGPSARLGACWFAVGTVTNLAIGRLTFALGLAIGLGAVWALQRGTTALGLLLALLCPLASPVAGVFLGLAALAWLMRAGDARGRALAMCVGALATGPVLLLAGLYPEGGTFPFQPVELGLELGTCALLYAVMRRRHPMIGAGALLYAAAAAFLFVVPTPLGGNFGRLGMYFAGPLLACALWPHRKALLAAVAPALLLWAWVPAADAVLFAGLDPSTHREYFTPLVRYLKDRPGPPPRVEIPFTLNHWETAFVAPDVPLARGWERQLDVATNPIFYSDHLDAAGYHEWLIGNAVEYVAVADAPIDFSAVREVRLIRSGLAYLHPVWHDAHWSVYSVAGARPMVEGPARLMQSDDDSMTLRVRAPGRVMLRVHYTEDWVVDADACITPAPHGWTFLYARAPGTITMTAALFGDAACDSPG
jgi:hypothetical protein